jgi:hypothetical protein
MMRVTEVSETLETFVIDRELLEGERVRKHLTDMEQHRGIRRDVKNKFKHKPRPLPQPKVSDCPRLKYPE